MEAIDINQALPQIRELIEIASNGTEIVITDNEQPLVKLVSLKTSSKRSPLFGSDQDILVISDDFDEPLEDFRDYL
jgi:antitoxin (DNA-binding transcriptional repressor) of toxin-antitoxin stability system